MHHNLNLKLVTYQGVYQGYRLYCVITAHRSDQNIFSTETHAQNGMLAMNIPIVIILQLCHHGYSAKAAAIATTAVTIDKDLMPMAPLHCLVELAVISVTAVLPASTTTLHCKHAAAAAVMPILRCSCCGMLILRYSC